MPEPRELMWRRTLDDLSFETATVVAGSLGPQLAGTVLVAEGGLPLKVDYRISCDGTWVTRSVEVAQTYRGSTRTLRLEHDGQGHWRIDGRDAPQLAGCADVDLGVSPSTNALPINRLLLQRGEESIIRAAWVRFPDLTVEAASQSYARTAERTYRYRSLASGFTAALEVDSEGLPLDYAGVWRRVAEGPVAPAAGFAAALLAPGPAPEIAEAAGDFAWLVGGWDAQVRDFLPDGRVLHGVGEWWFAWVLEGRAMQDVWISPPRATRAAARGPDAAKDRYGATLRHFDRKAGVWRISWFNPVSGAVNSLAGRREGDRIELLGEEGGTPMRWTFNEIAQDSFRWLGEAEVDGIWRREAEFQLRRKA